MFTLRRRVVLSGLVHCRARGGAALSRTPGGDVILVIGIISSPATDDKDPLQPLGLRINGGTLAFLPDK